MTETTVFYPSFIARVQNRSNSNSTNYAVFKSSSCSLFRTPFVLSRSRCRRSRSDDYNRGLRRKGTRRIQRRRDEMISSGRQSFRRRRVSDTRYKSVSKRCVYRVRISARKSLETERNRVGCTVNRFKSRRCRITRRCLWESAKNTPVITFASSSAKDV